MAINLLKANRRPVSFCTGTLSRMLGHTGAGDGGYGALLPDLQTGTGVSELSAVLKQEALEWVRGGDLHHFRVHGLQE